MNILFRSAIYIFTIVWWSILLVMYVQGNIDYWWWFGVGLNFSLTVGNIYALARMDRVINMQQKLIEDLTVNISRMKKQRMEPPPGLLMSIAMRLDHGLGAPGYYDQPIFSHNKVSHKEHLDSTLLTARQVYDEVMGYGFYSPEREADYVKLMTATERDHE
jgi:hypothetical protein